MRHRAPFSELAFAKAIAVFPAEATTNTSAQRFGSLATFHRKYKASKRVFMGFRLIVRC
jgi:hypothetical protein